MLSSSAFAQSKATQKLFTAIEKNNTTLAQNALKEGADVNGMNGDDKPLRTTALIRAVQLNRPEIVNLLIAQHADVNLLRPMDNHSALMVAANKNLKSIAELLIKNGADVNAESLFERTALHISALSNSLEVAEVLLSAKDIDVNVRPNYCALAVAARQGHVSIVKLLKSQTGAKAPNPVCLEKALEVAVLNKHEVIVNILSRSISFR